MKVLHEPKSTNIDNLKNWKDQLTVFLQASTSGTFANTNLVNNLYDVLLRYVNYPSIPKTNETQVALASEKDQFSNQDKVTFIQDVDEEILSAELSASAEQAKSFKIGAWFYQPEENEKSQYVKLVWMNVQKTRFALVSLQGIKCGEWKIQEIAQKIMQKNLLQISDDDLMLINLGIEGILNRVLSQLSYQYEEQQSIGLVDSLGFEGKLNEALASAIHKRKQHVLGFIKLHQMELVRREYGYKVSDHLLKEISKLFSIPSNLRYTLAIVSNEQFCLLLEDCSDEQAMPFVLEQIRRIKNSDIFVDGISHCIDVSIGLTIITCESETVPALLNQAEIASIAAMKEDKNTVKIFSPDDVSVAKILLAREWAKKVHTILDEDLLKLRAQKITSLKGASLKPFYEILLGVMANDSEIISPQDFIDACRQHNMIADVDLWVLSHCLQWMAQHKDALQSIEAVAIKVANESLENEHFIQYLQDQANKHSIPLEKICLEIEESVIGTHFTTIAPLIDRLKAIGCKCTIDRFGTGSQTYAYLDTLKVDFLKIDGSLAKGMATQKSDLLMGRSIIVIGRSSGKRIIAEHIENEEMLNKVRELGVDYGQGNFIEPPVLLDSLFMVSNR